MSRYGSGFREPPWVMGSPREVMDWVDASHPEKKNKNDREKNKFLNNLQISFDFDVKKKEIESSSILGKIFRKKIIEEDFDLFTTAKFILRGLAKAKFKNTAKIIVDGIILYNHPEKKTDLRRTIEQIDEFIDQIRKGKTFELSAILDDVEKAIAIINISKIHKKNQNSVHIRIKGKIKVEIYHTFLNYLNEKVGIIKH
jgi:hypothetical protein